MGRRLKKPYRRLLKILLAIAIIVALKWIWVLCSTWGHGSYESEKAEILRRRNYLVNNLVSSPEEVLAEMPSCMGEQFRGEWAMYSCSMLTAALVNIAKLYPEEREASVANIDKLISIVMSEQLRQYDAARWDEDPLESLDGEKSHMSYLSILAWMISGYKATGGSNKYDDLYYKVCRALNWRMKNSPTLNLRTYPDEPIYVPDMLVTIVALSNFSHQCDDRYKETIDEWVRKAKTEWKDKKTGLLKSYLNYYGSEMLSPIQGSYSALNSYYLTFVDEEFAKEQYEILKKFFIQQRPFGITEYYTHSCWFELNIDSGPIILNLSPSGTAFAIGCATYFNDAKTRLGLLKTAEIAGSTIRGWNTNHYLLANFALVGEAVALAMRTSVPWFK